MSLISFNSPGGAAQKIEKMPCYVVTGCDNNIFSTNKIKIKLEFRVRLRIGKCIVSKLTRDDFCD